jgi:hypothetical protein
MSVTRDRFKADWYDKKIKQNTKIQKHLISIIEKHKGFHFPFKIKDLYCLGYEDLLEIAIATVNKKISITLGAGSDFNNGVDAKFSIARKNNYGRNYTAGITKCEHKDHIFACVYEGIQEKFYYFSFPSTLKEHSIPFDKETGEPRTDNYMWNYEYTTFEKMALSV